jgi:hypothetical protein
MNMTRTPLLLLVYLAVSAPVAIAAPEKPAWRWSDTERIAARTDASSAAARVQAFMARADSDGPRARTEAVHPSSRMPFDIIDGNVHPELFFPTELLRHFVLLAFVTRPNGLAQNVAEYSSDLFRQPGELDQLEAIAAPYTAALRAERDLLAERHEARGRAAANVNAELTVVRGEECRAMASVFSSARQQFGGQLLGSVDSGPGRDGGREGKTAALKETQAVPLVILTCETAAAR